MYSEKSVASAAEEEEHDSDKSMGVINLGMSIMGIDQNFQKVVKGVVLLAAVVFDVLSKREKVQ